MRQLHKSKRRHGSGRRQPVPLPADARDPDIVHAHRVARRRQARDRASQGGQALASRKAA